MLVFPALLALRERKAAARPPLKISLAPRHSTLEKLFARPGLIVAVAMIATLAAGVEIRKVTFDQNVLRLQANDAEAVRYENILLRDSGRSSWFAVALAATRKSADREAAAFRHLPEVSAVETIATYIPTDQTAKLATLGKLRQELAPVTFASTPPGENPRALARALKQFAAQLAALAPLDPSHAAAKTRELAVQALDRLRENPHAFAAYQNRIAADLRMRLELLKHQLTPTEITEQTLPPVLRDRFIGASGLYLVQVYPKGDVWADAQLKRFVTALRTVDIDVTGPPVQTYTLGTVMRQGYEHAAILALIAVFAFVFFDFRNLRDTLLATVPLVFGGLWLLEAMAALGWEFNLANLFAVPIVIGMGVDNGVNMLYRWREERDKSSLILTKAVGKSVTICSLTTIAAFAALIPASHRGISSLGWVMTLGVSFILLATLIVLPALFELFGPRLERADRRATSADDCASAAAPAPQERHREVARNPQSARGTPGTAGLR
jgi:preprotein translocase subunit SecF